MSVIYTPGVVVELDTKRVFKLCKRSAGQGLAAAQNDLGFMYAGGIGLLQRQDLPPPKIILDLCMSTVVV
jgi:TPR repeat protein